MASQERPQSGEEPSSEGHISFVKRVQRQFGHDIEPITLQSQDEEAEGSSASGSSAASASRELVRKLAGHELGPRYEITREIARGGMGTVLRVWDEDLRRNLAMKVMHGHGRVDDESGSADIDQEKLGRFLEEAQITGQLDHPGIVPVHDLGIDSRGRCYFTMRLVRGRELKEILDLAREGKEGWTRTRALGLILKVCEAMAYAHSKGVVHRDLKPSNVMVGRFGEVYVMDWGLARVLGRRDSHDLRLRPGPEDPSGASLVRTVRKDESMSNPDSPLITMDGDVVGTPSYMAVEQAQGKLEEVGPRSDVYSLGSILYYMLTGRAPYVKPGERVSPHTVLSRVLDGPPPPIRKMARDEPAELIAICEKAMARDASERYASMLEVADDIQAFLDGRVVTAYEGGSLAEFRKWVARNRGVAAGIAGMITLSIVSALGFAWQKQKQVDDLNLEKSETAAAKVKAELAADQAREALARSEENERKARESAFAASQSESEARRSGYMANILAADYSLKLNDVEEAREHLRGCDLRLRGWEWDHLSLMANPALRSLGQIWPGGIDQVATSPDGRILLTLARNGRVRFHHVEDGNAAGGLPAMIVVPAPAPNEIGALLPMHMSLTADGSRVAIVGTRPRGGGNDNERGRIMVFDVAGGKLLLDLPLAGTRGHDARVGAVAFSRDGRFLATGADDGSIIQWDANGQVVNTFTGHRRPVTDLSWSPDSRLLASASLDETVRVWDTTLGQAQHELRGHLAEVNAVAWDHTGQFLFSAGADRLVNKWDAVGGRLLSTFSGHTAAINSIDYDPVADRLATASDDRTVRIWNVEDGRELALLRGHEASVYDAVFTPDGGRIVSSSADGEVLIWDARGDLAITDLSLDGWESSRYEGSRGDVPGAARLSPVEAVAFHPDGVLVATGGGTRPDQRAGTSAFAELVLWDSLSGEPLRRLRGHEDLVNDVAFSPDGRWLYSASEDATVRRWDVETGHLANVYRHDQRVTALALTPDGSRLITGCGDNLVRVLDPETGEVLRELSGHRRPVTDIAVSPDGTRVATSRLEIRVWNLLNDGPELVIEHPSLMLSLAFSPDGKQLAGALMRRDVSIWDSETGELLASEQDHEYRCRAVAYSPDGRRLASGAGDGTIRIRETKDARTVMTLDWEQTEPTTLAFSSDGTRLIAGSKEGRVRIWESGDVGLRRERSLRALALREEAKPLVGRLFDETFFLQDVVLALQNDEGLTPELRQMAIRFAYRRGDDAVPLTMQSIHEALVPGASSEVYERARDRAYAAQEILGPKPLLGPREPDPHAMDRGLVQLALGMTQYRTGEYDQAIRALERASLEVEGFGAKDETIRLLFLAMAQFRQGSSSGANVSLTLANVKIEADPQLTFFDDELEKLLTEAEVLILREES